MDKHVWQWNGYAEGAVSGQLKLTQGRAARTHLLQTGMYFKPLSHTGFRTCAMVLVPYNNANFDLAKTNFLKGFAFSWLSPELLRTARPSELVPNWDYNNTDSHQPVLFWNLTQRVRNPQTQQQLLTKQSCTEDTYFNKAVFAFSRRYGSSLTYRIVKTIFWLIRCKLVWGVREYPISLLSLSDSRKQVTYRSQKMGLWLKLPTTWWI